jgi:hypothetical protein
VVDQYPAAEASPWNPVRWISRPTANGSVLGRRRSLDREVTVIDAEENADELEHATAGATTLDEPLRLASEHRATRGRGDVPTVEDLPVHPEDEDDEMTNLAHLLPLRLVRAGRRWRGEDVTLRQVIEEAVYQHLDEGRGTSR